MAQETAIHIDAAQPGRSVSRYLTGACIEDVNHEIYGGLYSQMIFGESFQEPARSAPIRGFVATDGEWTEENGQVLGGAGAGPKLISSVAPFVVGEAGVEVLLAGTGGGNAGLILRVAKAGAGADAFDGYEVAIDVARKVVVVGRHEHDFRLLKDIPCDVLPDRWISLAVKLTERVIEVIVDGKGIARIEDNRPLPAGTIGLRQWQRPARYRNLWVKGPGGRVDLPFEAASDIPAAISGMWGPIAIGDAVLEATIDKTRPFVGVQSQRITFVRGDGEVGIENQGLNRQGMAFVEGKTYEGYLWLRCEQPTDVFASLESRDGARLYAQSRVRASGDDWRRYKFSLTPDRADSGGRFSLRLKSAGSVTVGHVFLQPGGWGRFKGLPVRRDVGEALIEQGITVLRYGGSMVNAPEYRWKKMIGPRDHRPPYRGTWYPYSTNGWGIIDLLDFCEAAGFLAIPDFNMDESPEDMADFVEYVNGPVDSEWGRRRVADGHTSPYNLRHIQLGNEEKVDEAYYEKFEKLAKVLWAKDPRVILVVGDFAYDRRITDPMRIEGTASGIKSLAAHKKILSLAREHGREVWFDVHLWTEGPGRSESARAFRSYVDAIERLAEGAKHHVVVFEFNANNHDHRRGLANAFEIGRITRDGRIPVALSANCLQVDKQNDNGWNQGLLFLNPSKVWLQSPGYVTQMLWRNYQPRVIETQVRGGDDEMFSVTATRSEDGKQIVLQVVNLDSRSRPTRIEVSGFAASSAVANVEELSGSLDSVNTADAPARIAPRRTEWRHNLNGGGAEYEFPPHSFTTIRLW